MLLTCLLLLSLSPSAAEGKLAEAARLADQRQERPAIAIYEEIAAADEPQAPGFWLNLGKLHERAGDDLAALRAYRMVPLVAHPPPAEWWERIQEVRRRLAPSDQQPPTMERIRAALVPWALRTPWPLTIFMCSLAVTMLPQSIFAMVGPVRWRLRVRDALLIVIGLWFLWLLSFILLMPSETKNLDRPWIIVKRPTPLREGNGASYAAADAEPLRRGTEGRLTARRPNGWVRVELDDGRAGWLPGSALFIGPASHRLDGSG